jgi:hypothetical protein
MSESEAPPAMQLVITMDTTNGKVGVAGPIQNELLCLGLLEMAKVALYEHWKGSPIIPVKSVLSLVRPS